MSEAVLNMDFFFRWGKGVGKLERRLEAIKKLLRVIQVRSEKKGCGGLA